MLQQLQKSTATTFALPSNVALWTCVCHIVYKKSVHLNLICLVVAAAASEFIFIHFCVVTFGMFYSAV